MRLLGLRGFNEVILCFSGNSSNNTAFTLWKLTAIRFAIPEARDRNIICNWK